MYDLRTLGTLDLRGPDGAPVAPLLAQPKRAALLAYLVLARPHGPVRRDVLLATFWPEMSDDRARAALRNALSFLRKAAPGVLDARGDDAVAVADSVSCDARRMERALADGDVPRALAEYGGELLAGVHVGDAPAWEHWRDAERVRLRQVALAAARTAAECARDTGDAAAAVAMARRACEIDPDDEPALRRLMELLGESGDPAGALREYDRFAARLMRELEVHPAAETEFVRRALRIRTVPHLVESTADAASDANAISSASKSSAIPPTATHGGWNPIESHPIASDARVSDSVAPGLTASDPLVADDVSAPDGGRRVAFSAIPIVSLPNPTQADESTPWWRKRRMHRGALAVAVVAGLGMTAGAVHAWMAPAPGDPGLVLITPFEVLGAQRYAYLGEGMVDLLAVRLDGAGGVRAVDPHAVMAADRDEAERFGAGLVVRGTVIAAGDRLEIAATLYGPDGRVRARSAVQTAGDADLFGTVDGLARGLLGAAADGMDGRPARTASLTTASLPALRAYLDGEAAFRNRQYREAVAAYTRALRADSGFALA